MTEPSPPPSDVPTRTLTRMGKTGITQLRTGASKLARVPQGTTELVVESSRVVYGHTSRTVKDLKEADLRFHRRPIELTQAITVSAQARLGDTAETANNSDRQSHNHSRHQGRRPHRNRSIRNRQSHNHSRHQGRRPHRNRSIRNRQSHNHSRHQGRRPHRNRSIRNRQSHRHKRSEACGTQPGLPPELQGVLQIARRPAQKLRRGCRRVGPSRRGRSLGSVPDAAEGGSVVQ